MARGYPAPKERAPEFGAIVAPGTCPICKRRPVALGETKCATCAEALRGP